MNIVRCFLAVSISLSLMACGNESSDKPDALPQIPQPPAGGYEPDFSDFETVASINLAELKELTGQALIDGLEQQLNDTLFTRSSTAKFEIIPQWGYDTNLRVVNVNGYYALETTLAAGKVGKPSKGDLNGFSFKISLPNGVVKHAALSYQLSLSKPLGFGDAAKSPDYIYLPGLTSGAPEVQNNKPAIAGTGFTYKFSTDRYGYLNTKYADPTNGDLTNAQLQYAEKGIKPTQGQWDLIQQNITVNDFNYNAAQANGSVTTYFNREVVTPQSGSTTDRILVDDTHPYNLQALVEVYRYYKNGADDINAVQEQKVHIKNLSFAWNNDEVALPPPVDDQPVLVGYPNIKGLDLELLAGKQGSDLVAGIEQQLNKNLPEGTTGTFKVTPKWGFDGASNWDSLNLDVVNIQGQYVLQTVIAAEAVGQPTTDNAIQNGFSFLIELPNGRVKEATMSYLYRLSTPLGYDDPTKSPDYIFLPGFTSGDPFVKNAASQTGQGFTYKLNTDRYGKLSTRFIDATDNKFYNSVLQQNDSDIRIDSNVWNLVQQKLKTNDFISNTSTADGSLDIMYKTNSITPKAGAIEGRTQVDASHDYKLSALMEVYRHWMHSSDNESDLKEQVVQIKNITFAWKDDEISQPTVPSADNYCSAKDFTQSRTLDLTLISDLTGQALLDEIGQQLGDLPSGSLSFGNNRDNIRVVENAGELALEVTYAAAETGQAATANGTDFSVPFPTGNSNLRGACFAYDLNIAIATNENKDVILLPSILLNSNNNLLSDHRYATNKYKRFSAKFINPPHADLSWLDYSGNNYVNANTWYKMNQHLQFGDNGTGTIDFQMNDVTYFKPNAGKFGGEVFENVNHQLVDVSDVDHVQFTANFDTYRHDAGGDKLQAIQYKNIAIGWNTEN
ncbi:hypothetical protein [Vibrio furnissii]|uniref:hypothetical protein n=1 Tax=Vibrio furnissii TaxID=29494 RepID=UPI0012AE12FC|nr:hypothetical protein [Vibrio furnissii]